MPSSSIWARSRTSHSRWNSAAIFRAASAMREGVRRLAGSLTKARVKFWASPEDASAGDGGFVRWAPATTNSWTDFLVVAGLVAVGLEIAQDGAFDGGASEVRSLATRGRGEGDLFHRFGLQAADGGTCQLCAFRAASNFSGFPTPPAARAWRQPRASGGAGSIRAAFRRPPRNRRGRRRRNVPPSALRRPARSGHPRPPGPGVRIQW